MKEPRMDTKEHRYFYSDRIYKMNRMNSKPVNPVSLVENIRCSKDSGRNGRDRRAVLAGREPFDGIRAEPDGSADGNGSPTAV